MKLLSLTGRNCRRSAATRANSARLFGKGFSVVGFVQRRTRGQDTNDVHAVWLRYEHDGLPYFDPVTGVERRSKRKGGWAVRKVRPMAVLSSFRPTPFNRTVVESVRRESRLRRQNSRLGLSGARCLRATLVGRNGSYLVDPASSHMLVSKIKPCMSKHKPLHGEAANGSLGHP